MANTVFFVCTWLLGLVVYLNRSKVSNSVIYKSTVEWMIKNYKLLVTGVILFYILCLFVETKPVYDATYYKQFTLNLMKYGYLSHNDGTVSAYRAIGLPGIYFVIYKLFGLHDIYIKIFNIFISFLVAFVFYKSVSHMSNLDNAKYLTLLLMVYPSFFAFNYTLLTEQIFVLLLLAGLLVFQKYHNPFLVGFFIGASTYFRPIGFIMLLSFYLYFIIALLMKKRSFKIFLKESLLISLGVSIVISPWIYRNYRAFHRMIPMSAVGGANLAVGNNPYLVTGGFVDLYSLLPDSEIVKYHLNSKNDVIRDDGFRQLARDYIRSNPKAFLFNGFKKIKVTMFKDTSIIDHWLQKGGYSKRSLQMIAQIMMVVITIFGLAHLFKEKPGSDYGQLVKIFIILYLITIAVIVGEDRFQYPLTILLLHWVVPPRAIMGNALLSS